MEPIIAFEHITQTHLLVLNEYARKSTSLKNCAINCRMKLADFKRELTTALGLAGEISFFEPRGKARKKLEHFFRCWDEGGHQPKPEPPRELEPPPRERIRPSLLPVLHDTEITPRQMECLRQYVSQPSLVVAAHAVKLPRAKFKLELHAGLYHAARICLPNKALSVMAMSKVQQVGLIHDYFYTLRLMDDPAF